MKHFIVILTFITLACTVRAQSDPSYFKATRVTTGRIERRGEGVTLSCTDIFLVNPGLGEITVISEAAKVYRIKSVQKRKTDDLEYFEFKIVDRNNAETTFLHYTFIEKGTIQNVILMLPDGLHFSEYYVDLKKTW